MKMRRGVTRQFTNQTDQVNGSNIEVALQRDEISKVNQMIALQEYLKNQKLTNCRCG